MAYGGKDYKFEGNRRNFVLAPGPVDLYYLCRAAIEDGVVPRPKKQVEKNV